MDGKIVGKNGEIQLYDPTKLDLNFVVPTWASQAPE